MQIATLTAEDEPLQQQDEPLYEQCVDFQTKNNKNQTENEKSTPHHFYEAPTNAKRLDSNREPTACIYTEAYPYKSIVSSSLHSHSFPESKDGTPKLNIVPRSCLNFKERIGGGEFGDIFVAELVDSNCNGFAGVRGELHGTPLVAVKSLKSPGGGMGEEFAKVWMRFTIG